MSDAIEQLDGKRMYLSHRMQAIAPEKFVGFATTVRLAKEENHDPHALDGMLAAIDAGCKDSVYVMSIEGWREHCRHGRINGNGNVSAWFCRSGD